MVTLHLEMCAEHPNARALFPVEVRRPRLRCAIGAMTRLCRGPVRAVLPVSSSVPPLG